MLAFSLGYTIGLPCSVVATASGLIEIAMVLFAQTVPVANDSLLTALGPGVTLLGGGTLATALTILANKWFEDRKNYWEDRERQRLSEERKLKITSMLARNNYVTKEIHEWVVDACTRNPNSFRAPPHWIDLDTGEQGNKS